MGLLWKWKLPYDEHVLPGMQREAAEIFGTEIFGGLLELLPDSTR